GAPAIGAPAIGAPAIGAVGAPAIGAVGAPAVGEICRDAKSTVVPSKDEPGTFASGVLFKFGAALLIKPALGFATMSVEMMLLG
ncbi:hypothetical protein EBZ39_07595, partial [bacterium]|nr:hypothetical protein [bacterium]